ncbi:MAG: MBL fold metallo-hydrolase [Deltaproteobacteria bacterium]|nr:MBL fold metallo-hydrolase [Deltaproteobacteria bacterium]
MKGNIGKHIFPALLSENLWVLGNYYFSLYLVQGNNASALIEVGISAITDTVINQLESLNVSPTYLVVTHPHADHLTGLDGLYKRFPDAMIVAGQGTQDFITHPKALKIMINEDRYMAKMLSALGIKPGRSPIEKFSFPDNHIVVKDNHEIDLGSIILRCVKVKGHSPGNIIVHIPETDALILSDSLGFHYPGRCFLPLFFTGFSEYMASMDYMKSLRPTILGLGHQGPITGANVESAFRNSRQAALNIYSRIIGEQKNSSEIADDLFTEFYKDEFTLYSEENIRNCTQLLVRRSMEAPDFQKRSRLQS